VGALRRSVLLRFPLINERYANLERKVIDARIANIAGRRSSIGAANPVGIAISL